MTEREIVQVIALVVIPIITLVFNYLYKGWRASFDSRTQRQEQDLSEFELIREEWKNLRVAWIERIDTAEKNEKSCQLEIIELEKTIAALRAEIGQLWRTRGTNGKT